MPDSTKPLPEPVLTCHQWVALTSDQLTVRSECDSKNGTFNVVLLTGIFRSSRDDALRWMPQDLTVKSTLAQVMAWCRQATSHYLNQCWLSLLSPYSVTRPQWVKYTLIDAARQQPITWFDINPSYVTPYGDTDSEFIFVLSSPSLNCMHCHHCYTGMSFL